MIIIMLQLIYIFTGYLFLTPVRSESIAISLFGGSLINDTRLNFFYDSLSGFDLLYKNVTSFCSNNSIQHSSCKILFDNVVKRVDCGDNSLDEVPKHWNRKGVAGGEHGLPLKEAVRLASDVR